MNLFKLLENSTKTNNGIIFVDENEKDKFVSYKDLFSRANKRGLLLKRYAFQEQEKMIICCKSDEAVILNFWACVLHRFIPTIVPYIEKEQELQRTYNVWNKIGKGHIITDRSEDFKERWSQAEFITHDCKQVIDEYVLKDEELNDETINAILDWTQLHISPEDLFMLQFSSGSTGDPKGILLKSGNIVTECMATCKDMRHSENDIFCSWKPLSHDYGLIAFHIMPMVIGAKQIRMAIDLFLKKPEIWIQRASQYRATIIAAPNFGYRLFVDTFDKNLCSTEGWDLSCVRIAQTGSERISKQVCDAFIDALTDFGLSPKVMKAAYGLAENTLMVSCDQNEDEMQVLYLDRNKIGVGDTVAFCEKEDENAFEVVSVGRITSHSKVRIMYGDEEVYGRIGEVQVSGPCVVDGYYENEEDTANLKTSDGWLRTGDLGFIHEEKLSIVGRLKETIIVGGKNYNPQDIEEMLMVYIEEPQISGFAAGSVHNAAQAREDIIIFVEYHGEINVFGQIQNAIRKEMNEHLGMIPSIIVPVEKLTKTASGKLQRLTLVNLYKKHVYDEILARVEGEFATENENTLYVDKEIEKGIREEIHHILGADHVHVKDNLMDIAVSSLALTMLVEKINERFQTRLNRTKILENPTIAGLIQLVKGNSKIIAKSVTEEQNRKSSDIAIIGMALSFPGGITSAKAYWEALLGGEDLLEELPEGRWKEYRWNKDDVATTRGGYLQDVDMFDAPFFGISGVEAKEMDPQQRLLLELSWKAIENAGYAPRSLRGKEIGVFVGISNNDYLHMEKDLNSEGQYSYTGNMYNSAAGRLSYFYDLKGPSMAVDTACSSAIYSIKQACMAIGEEDCDIAMVGAVNLILTPDMHINFSKLGALSKEGRCSTFDQAADGYVRSEGGAILILKRLDKAEEDRDHILGVIKSCVVNHNGRTGGLTVPSGTQQARMIQKAIEKASLTQDDIDYVETHGTGTKVGDPQELSALQEIFGAKKEKLKVGSVKSNLGHLEAASGMASIIKVLLSLQNKQIPRSLHFYEGNPIFDWEMSNIAVVTENSVWDKANETRYAGITSLGISGSNGHLILASYEKEREHHEMPEDQYLLLLSTNSNTTIPAYLEGLRDWDGKDQYDLGTICYNLAQKESLRYRSSVVVRKDMKLDAVMTKMLRKSQELFIDGKKTKRLAYVFSGQGSQYLQMGSYLYKEKTKFREEIDEIFRILGNKYRIEIKEILFGKDDFWTRRPLYTQLGIFAMQVALTALWESMDVTPDVIYGHSIGEFAAVYAAGGISLEDAIDLVYHRASVIEESQIEGKMAAVLADLDYVQGLLDKVEGVYVAAVNTFENITISGRSEAIDEVANLARADGVFVEELTVYQPFHSLLMQAVADRLKPVFERLQMKPFQVAFYSTIRKEWIEIGETLPNTYWYEQLMHTVEFADASREVFSKEDVIGMEIGANAVVSGIITQVQEDAVVIPSQRKGLEKVQLLSAVGKLWEHGIDVCMDTIYEINTCDRIFDLPNTIFQKKKYWVELGNGSREKKEYQEVQEKVAQVVETASVLSKAEMPDIKEELYSYISELLYVEKDQINDVDSFFSFGMDSLRLFQLKNQIQQVFHVEIQTKDLFGKYNNIEALVKAIQEQSDSKKQEMTLQKAKIQGWNLSKEEKGIYFISQTESGNIAYQNIRIIHFHEKVDVQILKEKVETVRKRHELLQCVYTVEGTGIIHRVEPERLPECMEAQGLNLEDEKEFCNKLYRKFEWKDSLLWRWGIYETNEHEWKACFVFHHIIADNYATDVFVRELEATFAGKELDATDSYANYIQLQDNRKAEESKNWWQQKLTPVPPRLQFQLNKDSESLDRFKGNTVVFHIDNNPFEKAKEVIETKGYTAFNFYLSVWAIVLSKMGREKKYVIGTPFDHRADGCYHNTIGTFVDTLPLLVEVDATKSFSDFVQEMQKVCFDSIDHSDYPFDEIVADLGIKPDKDKNPLYDVMFTYVNGQKENYSFDQVDGTLEYTGNGYTTFDLTIGMVEHQTGLTVKFDFSTLYFNETKANEYINEFAIVLNSVLNEINKPILELLSMTEEEKQEILELSCGEIRDMEQVTFRSIMKRSFQEYATMPAIEFGEESLTYAGLESKIRQAASALKRIGVEHGDGVAILLPLSPDVVIMMLAVQRVGAYWIPLDVAFPKDRVEYVLEKSEAKLMVCKEDYLYKDELAIRHATMESIQNEKGEMEYDSNISPEDTAYVIFTSGTTGKPKGVELPQRALNNFLIGMKEALHWEPCKKVACMTTPSFDIFLLETMLTLANGGCVVISRKEEIMSPERIADFVISHHVNYLQLTPTRLKMIDVDRTSTEKILKNIEAIFIGGEQFPADLLPVLQTYKKQIYNVYGPTETCIWSTVKDLSQSEKVTIGRPILNTYTYILDENGAIVPQGVEGDLWIGGLGVALGYINDPGNTQARFKENVFHSGVMYTTGDRAKWENGELICLGRNDFQVKIRGYRIELEEIEKVILQYPGIHNAVVCVKDQANGNKILIAFYETSDELDKTKLKEFTAQKLPSYMMPSSFVEVEEFPTTQSGKVDRKQLLLLKQDEKKTETKKNTLIEQIEQIFKNVLGLEEIELDSSFFDLGGNSFSLVILIKQINETCGVSLDITELFADSSVLGINHLITMKSQKTQNDLISLPKQWMNHLKNSEYAMTAKISDEMLWKIREYENKNVYGRESIFASVLATCISKKLDDKQFGFWMVQDEKKSRFVRFDFVKKNTIGECISTINEVLGSQSNLVEHQELTGARNDEEKVRVCIGDLRYISYKYVQTAYDVIFGYSIEEKRIRLQTKNGIDEKKLTELLNSYMYILQILVAKL